MRRKYSVTAKAPSTTANLGPGFDVFGLAINAFYDKVTIQRSKRETFNISAKGRDHKSIPLSPTKNTAGLVVKEMAKRFKIRDGFNITIEKGVPAGFGMGSSAASAAAAAVAFDEMYNLGLGDNDLVEFAGHGEKASAGSVHYDNVAASLLGGFVIVKTKPLDVIKISPPKDLVLCVAVPELKVPTKKTKVSRGVLPQKIRLKDSVENMANAASIVAGFAKKDSYLIGRSIIDIIVEPARMHMIPGFKIVKREASKAGALGMTISGAGPSVIAFTTADSKNHEKICKAMKSAFKKASTNCETLVCRPSKGASIIKRQP